MAAPVHEEADPCEHPMAYEARAGVDDDGPWASYRCDDCGWWDTIYDWEVTAGEQTFDDDAVAPTRTWDDDHGPMVEPEPDVVLEARARDILNRLDPTVAGVLRVQGQHVSDRLAREAAERRARIDASHAVSAASRWGDRLPGDFRSARAAAEDQYTPRSDMSDHAASTRHGQEQVQ